MHPRTRLALLRSLQEKKKLAKGFTLVELMITVAVVGILSAVALPAFLNARDAAEAGAHVGEAIGIAKECATLAASDIGTAPTDAGSFTVACDATGGTVNTTWAGSNVEGVRCLTDTSAAGDTGATITIGSNGSMSCAFS